MPNSTCYSAYNGKTPDKNRNAHNNLFVNMLFSVGHLIVIVQFSVMFSDHLPRNMTAISLLSVYCNFFERLKYTSV